MSVSIHRAQLRELLFSALRTDSDFVAFALDYFPDVQQKFSSGMDRVSKVNLLLESEDSDEILKALQRAHPEIAARLGHKHVLPAAPSPPSSAPTAQPNASDASSTPIRPDEPPQYVLHLSDMHFAESAQAAQWHTQLMLDLREQMQIESLSGIVLSGDTTNRASVDQFGHAQRFLERVCKTFSVPEGRLLVVPGNHDVNWNLTDSGQNGFPPYASFHQSVTGSEYPLDSAKQSTLNRWLSPRDADWARRLIRTGSAVELGLLRPDAVDLVRSTPEWLWGAKVWVLLVLEMWARGFTGQGQAEGGR